MHCLEQDDGPPQKLGNTTCYNPHVPDKGWLCDRRSAGRALVYDGSRRGCLEPSRDAAYGAGRGERVGEGRAEGQQVVPFTSVLCSLVRSLFQILPRVEARDAVESTCSCIRVAVSQVGVVSENAAGALSSIAASMAEARRSLATV